MSREHSMRRAIFALISMSFFIVPGVVSAQTNVPPEMNPMCWTEQECVDARTRFVTGKEKFSQLTENEKKEVRSGFVHKEGECSREGWGKCLPGGVTKTQIAFGGKTEFLHIGEFITANYKYAVGVASIIAVFMVIISGLQWVVSGGNADTISTAKNRIFGAVIGLFIAYSSYIILNTLNPALVNLRLPQTWMVKGYEGVPKFCNAMINTTTIRYAYVASKDEQMKKVKPDPKMEFNFKYEDTYTNSFWCGHRFFMNNGSDATCMGSFCNDNEVCLNFDENGVRTPTYQCGKGNIFGTIKYNVLMSASWELGEITDEGEQELWGVCSDGRLREVSSSGVTHNSSPKAQQFVIITNNESLDKFVEYCGGDAKVAGFVTKFEMNENGDPTDEDHFIGLEGGDGKDLGDKFYFYIDYQYQYKYRDEYQNKHGIVMDKNEYYVRFPELKKYYIPLSKVKSGVEMTINAEQVHDIDGLDTSVTDPKYDVYKDLF